MYVYACYIGHKRPMYMAKETQAYGKRDLDELDGKCMSTRVTLYVMYAHAYCIYMACHTLWHGKCMYTRVTLYAMYAHAYCMAKCMSTRVTLYVMYAHAYCIAK